MSITGLRRVVIGPVILATVSNHTPVFVVSAMLGPLGLIVTLVLAGRIGRITINRKEQTRCP